MEQAKDSGVPVKLNVMRVNPIIAFYKQLGFLIASSTIADFAEYIATKQTHHFIGLNQSLLKNTQCWVLF